MENYTTIRLPILFCVMIDIPESKIDCEPPPVAGNTVCVQCTVPGRYVTGGRIDEYGSVAHILSIISWLLITLFGTLGTFTNLLIIYIIKKHKERNTRRAFDFLLMVLASFDFTCCFLSVICATSMVTYFEDWNRGPVTLFLYYTTICLSLLGRSGSTYITVFITVERYLVIAHPINSSRWFSARRTKLMALVVILAAVLINIPRISSLAVDYNHEGQRVPCLQDLDLKYILRSTALETFWYDSLGSVHYQIDIWLPFPILFLFNVLIYIEIKKFTAQRQRLTGKQMREIRAIRMFVPVVVVLFLCNIGPTLFYILLHFQKIWYRELSMGLLILSMTINSAANLPIYYARGQGFRQEIISFLRMTLPDRCTQCLGFKSRNNHEESQSAVGGGEITSMNMKTNPPSVSASSNSK